MSVRDTQRRIDSREFSEWIAYHRISPIGPEREDWRAAMISATIANAFRSKGKAFLPEDFMPKFSQSCPEEKRVSLESAFRGFARAHNSRIGRGKARKTEKR